MEDDPLAASMRSSDEQISGETPGRLRQAAGKVSMAAGEAWEQTKEKAGTARERTEFFLRENPVPTVIGALALGVAIGLAIRYSSSSAEKEVEAKSPLGNVDLSILSLPFLWPLFKSMRQQIRRFRRCGEGWRRSTEKGGCRSLRQAAAQEVEVLGELSSRSRSFCSRARLSAGVMRSHRLRPGLRLPGFAPLQSHFPKCRC